MLPVAPPMSAYVIANIEVSDPDGYRASADQVSETIALYGGRYLARGGTCEVLEGDWKAERVVVLQFPTIDAARAWYGSPEYQAILPLRQASSRGQVLIADGLAV
jgi:uncharacterized protein (DUF1330 family)